MFRLFKFFRLLTRRFFEDLIAVRAASLAFTTLLSIVPLIIFIFYILSFFPMLHHEGKELENFVVTHFVANSANSILQELRQFVSQDVHKLSWLNVSALAFIGLLLIFNTVDAVNGVWRVKMTGFSAISLIFYWMVLIIAPIIFSVLLLVSSYLMSLPMLSRITHASVIAKPMPLIFPFLIEWLTFTLFNWVTPSCRVFWRPALIAGFITTVLFEVAKWGFVEYFYYFPTYQLVYGTLAIIPIFFVWVFLTWLIIIMCALICHLLQKTRLR